MSVHIVATEESIADFRSKYPDETAKIEALGFEFRPNRYCPPDKFYVVDPDQIVHEPLDPPWTE